jgi:hypothetical protein
MTDTQDSPEIVLLKKISARISRLEERMRSLEGRQNLVDLDMASMRLRMAKTAAKEKKQ